jgi:hypothetical protein
MISVVHKIMSTITMAFNLRARINCHRKMINEMQLLTDRRIIVIENIHQILLCRRRATTIIILTAISINQGHAIHNKEVIEPLLTTYLRQIETVINMLIRLAANYMFKSSSKQDHKYACKWVEMKLPLSPISLHFYINSITKNFFSSSIIKKEAM